MLLLPYWPHCWPRLLRWFTYGIGVVLLIALVSWFAVPPFLKNTLEQHVAVQIGRQLTVQRVAFNPFTLTVEVTGLNLYEADKKSRAFSVDQIDLTISPSSLFWFRPVVREVVVRGPYLNLVHKQQAGKEATNFSDVITRLASHPAQGKPVQYSISNIQLIGGAIQVDDQIIGKQVRIEDIKLGLPFVSNFAKAIDTFIEPGLSARVNGSMFELKGRTKPFSTTHETSLDINLTQLDLAKLAAFSPKPLPFTLNSGSLSSTLSLNFSTQKGAANISLSGAANLNNVSLSDKDGKPLLNVKVIHADIHEANLMKEHFSLSSLVISEPELWAGLNGSGKLNWLSLQTEDNQKKPMASLPKPAIDIAQFQVKNGAVHWSDAVNATPTMEMHLTKLNIDAQKVSTSEQAVPAKVNVSIGQEHHQRAQFVGEIDLAHAAASGQIKLSDFALADYQPYINRVLAANVAGNLSLTTQFMAQNGDIRLSQMSGALLDLSVSAIGQVAKSEPTLNLSRQDKNKRNVVSNTGANGGITADKITIENAAINTASKQVTVEKITLGRVQGEVFREVDGTIKVIDIVKKEEKNRHVVSDNVASDNAAKGSLTKSVLVRDISNQDGATKVRSWAAEINHLVLTDSNVVFSDQSTNPAVNIRADAIEAQIEKLSTTLDRPFSMMMRANLNKTGKVAVAGSIAQKSAQLDVDLRDFSAATLQPYFTEFLNITLEKGAISTTGKLNWTAPNGINYQGKLKSVNFSSFDKGTSNTFLKWKMLAVDGMDIGLTPKQRKITLGKIDVSDFYARAILSEQGNLNLKNIVVQHGEKAEKNVRVSGGYAVNVPVSPTRSNEPEQIIKVGQINLNNGTINYTDNFIKPHYSMRMTGMKGSIGTIQSDLAEAASINLNGKIDNDAPIFISGSLNPLITPLLLDIKMTANGIDLPRLTSYSAKYAGYPIEKGKLSLDVEYHVNDNKLTANNALKIDQLTFGEKVDSPTATDLPVLLVVSLLADRNGRINLDVPISGTLDDPEFTLGGLMMKVFLNLIGKVLTSPFSLLGHAVSGAEELSYVEFASGSTILTDDIKAKLDNLAKALDERPNLKLDIIGRADLNADTLGLRERKLSRQIKKLVALKETDDKDDAAASQTISDADRAQAISSIYSAASFEKPKYQIGLPKLLPSAEMESLILQNMPITEDDLRSLANRRASVVRAYLTDIAHVSSERMYSIAPKINDAVDKGTAARVDFGLTM